ncbi:MAG: glycosyltransferase family 2 protein [Dysgonamonadaceae bacterium]|jgi:dolichol-phosphate mannosyltransferase|nr:glycosyltransferase family 2 protein [Dysgonamonadaceae bacterium]
MKKKVSIVICCYNEEDNIPVVVDAIHKNMDSLTYSYEIILVNDGSSDGTLQVIETLIQHDEQLFYINLSRNFGHQNALKAGMDYATGDCVICMDGDMQHPPEMLPMFLEKWEEGYDVVYTRRQDNKSVSNKKRKTSALFYRLLNALSDIELEDGTADFRLLDRRVANVIAGMNSNDLFFRGLVKWIGFHQYAIDYVPNKRHAGESKYTFKKMCSLALQGITSFSVKPLYLSTYIGFFIAALSLLFIPYAIISYLYNDPMSGWASIIIAVGFLGGLQLSMIGIIGLYVGKIFIQTKGRPSYIVKDTNLRT